jgi:hypothetical protein
MERRERSVGLIVGVPPALHCRKRSRSISK